MNQLDILLHLLGTPEEMLKSGKDDVCDELGITCFDTYIAGIRAAARHQDTNEALQLMSRITARRVQLRNLLAEETEKCDM